MGCDISMHIEYRKSSTDIWQCFDTCFGPPRNYEMFSLMAGVRDTNGIVRYPVKGIPEDASIGVKSIIYKDQDCVVLDDFYHHHTWLTIEELAACINEYSGKIEDVFEFQAIVAVMKFIKHQGYETRIICWFYQ